MTVAMNAKSGWKRQILCTAEPRHAACLPDMPHAILLAEYANASPLLMRLSVLRAAGCPLTSCLICSRLQTCATTTTTTTTTTTRLSAEAGRAALSARAERCENFAPAHERCFTRASQALVCRQNCSEVAAANCWKWEQECNYQ